MRPPTELKEWRYDRCIEPTLGAVPLDEPELAPQEDATPYRWAISASALLHLVIFALLWSTWSKPTKTVFTPSDAIVLRLAPPGNSIPALSKDASAQVVMTSPENQTSSDQTSTPVPQNNLPIRSTTISVDTPATDVDTTELELPSTMQLRQIVESHHDSKNANFQSPSCSAQQRLSKLFKCADDLDDRASDSVINSTYEYFAQRNPSIQERRTDAIRNIETRLRGTGLDARQRETFLGFIDIDRQEKNTSTNVRIDGLRDQIFMNDTT